MGPTRIASLLSAVVLTAGVAVGGAIAKGKPPAKTSVTISATPNPVVYGSTVSITGEASGKNSAGSLVTLYAKQAPKYTAVTTVGTATTDSTGHYSFKVTPSVHTVYYVKVHTAPQATSPNSFVKVRVRISLRLSTKRPMAGQRVHFSGFVLPAYNGKYVLIQRRTATGWTTLRRAKLLAAKPTTTALGPTTRSSYSVRVRIFKTGTYRARFNRKDHLRFGNGVKRKLTVQ